MKDKTKWIRLLGSMALLVAVGCTNDPDPQQENQVQSDEDVFEEDVRSDAGADANIDAEVEDGGSDADGGAGDEDVEEDTEDVEEDVEEISPCEPMMDLGELGIGEQSVSVDFSQESAQWSTPCDNQSDGNSVLIAMVLPSFSVLHVESEVPLGVEMRFGNCGQSSSRYMCGTQQFGIPTSFGAPQAYLLLESLDDLDPDLVEVTLTTTRSEECLQEEGESECVVGDRARVCRLSVVSPDSPRWEEGLCPEGCEQGGCLGDSCSAPLLVTYGEPVEFENLALRDRHTNYAESCSLPGDDSEETLYRGRELVLELADLIEGDEVVIGVEVTGLMSWAFETIDLTEMVVVSIKNDCSDAGACLKVWGDIAEDLQFTVPADGDYFLVIESQSDVFDGQFEVIVDVF